MAKIQLIQAVARGRGLQHDRWYAPLGLISIANFLQDLGHDIEILDGQLLEEQEIIKRLDADIVGIGFYITSTEAAMRIAIAAKLGAATVVMGGQAATPLARQILQKQSAVDIVCRYDGEKPMALLAARADGEIIDLRAVPNIAFRNNNEIYMTAISQPILPELPFPNREIGRFDIRKHINAFKQYGSYEDIKGSRPTNAVAQRGCPRRSASQGCSFCARIDFNLRARTPQQAYDEYRYLVDEFEVDYICEDSDSWIRSKWLSELANIIESAGPVGAPIRIYGDPRDISPETARLLKIIGVDAVLIGVESGDDEILKMNGKILSSQQTHNAARWLGKVGIRLCDAYVLGMIGESYESINRTVRLAEELSGVCERQAAYWNIILPLPGSPIWAKMMQKPYLEKKYSQEYSFDISELREDYLREYCTLGDDPLGLLNKISQGLCAKAMLPQGEYIR